MSDYFEEMGWQPVEAERTNEHQMLLVARFFMENGIFFDEFDTESLAPPAALEVVRNLPEKPCSGVGERCAICLKPNVTTAEDAAIDDDGGDDDQQDGKSQTPADKVQIEEGGGAPTNNFKVLPCEHAFHAQCILPWLEKTNSCPLCRHELPTDDPAYEERKRHRQRAQQREEELDSLHNSMFG